MKVLLRPSHIAVNPRKRPVVTGTMILFRTEAEAEILATISGEYYRGSRDIDDPEEIIDIEARDEAGTVIDLTEREEEKAIEKLLEVAR